jgi:hypothetical protein
MKDQNIHGFTVDTKRLHHAKDSPIYHGFAVIVSPAIAQITSSYDWPCIIQLPNGVAVYGGASTRKAAKQIAKSNGLYNSESEALAAGITQAKDREAKYNAERARKGLPVNTQ